MDIMRPMSVGPQTMGYMDTNTKVGSQILTPGIKSHLKSFMQKASPEDRAKCLELLTSLDIGTAARQQAASLNYTPVPQNHTALPVHKHRLPVKTRRPKTAMADIGRRSLPGPYTTTYIREYEGVAGESGQNARPQSTRAFQASYDLAGPVGASTYDTEYYNKPQKKAESIRTGSSSGNRRNNPHPPEAFMNWRLPPRPGKEPAHSEWATELTEEMFDRVCRGQLRSTYQVDYLGLPQGHKVEGLYGVSEDWRARVPYTLDSSQRVSYKNPSQQPELKGNNSRYGCNKLKEVPANGVVPAVPKYQLHLLTRSTYDREYQDPVPGVSDPADVRDLGRQYGAQALARYQTRVDSPGQKETLTRMLQALHVRPPSTRPLSCATSSQSSKCLRPRPVIPPATCVSSPTSSRGPSRWEQLGVAV